MKILNPTRKIIFGGLITIVPFFGGAVTPIDTITERPAKDVIVRYGYNSRLKIKSGFYLQIYKGKTLVKGQYESNERSGRWKFYSISDTLQLEGNYQTGQRVGKWRAYYRNGQLSCEENYADGFLERSCRGFYPNGRVSFIKTYKNNKVDSLETYFYENGDVWYTRNYKDGILNGPAEKYYANGNIEEQEIWKDGKRDGDYRHYYENGVLWEYVQYKNGGVWNVIKCNGPEAKPESCATIKGGVKNGTGFVHFYDANGRLISEENYSDGKKEGMAKYYKYNLLTREGKYLADQKDGLWRYYNENGKLYAEISYLGDKQTGNAVYYSGNGRKISEGNFYNDKKDGTWWVYSEDGFTKWEFNYKNGKLEGKSKKYDLGNLVREGAYKDNTRNGPWTFYCDGIAHKKFDFSAAFYPVNSSNRPSVHPGEAEEIVSFAEHLPEFPGGQTKLDEYIDDNAVYPDYLNDKNIVGTIIVSFIVSSTGEITEAEIEKGIQAGLDEEAVGIILAMPRWNAGMSSGQPVAVRCKLPIHFSTDADDD